MSLDRLEQRYVDVDGEPARVLVIEGDGPTLVLVQPGSAVPEAFLPLVAELTQIAGEVRVVLPDLPGHGATPYRRRDGLGPHAVLARHVSLVLDALDVRRAVVGGSSLGAHIALSLALADPDRFTGVVAMGSASAFASEADIAAVVAQHNAASSTAASDDSLAGARHSLSRFLVDPEPPLDPAVVWAQHMSRTRPDVRESATALFADLADPELVRPDRVAERLTELHRPVLLVWGRLDRFADVRFGEAAAPRLPVGRLEVLSDCGHLLFLEQPGRVAGLVRDHLGWLTGG
jgi:pimeloyl-ACP methyl ester carboxylesterase